RSSAKGFRRFWRPDAAMEEARLFLEVILWISEGERTSGPCQTSHRPNWNSARSSTKCETCPALARLHPTKPRRCRTSIADRLGCLWYSRFPAPSFQCTDASHSAACRRESYLSRDAVFRARTRAKELVTRV